jgi:N utilization substance protein B
MATKHSRRLAREFALQGVYEWLVAGNDLRAIEHRLAELNNFEQADQQLLGTILAGVVREAGALDARLVPYLDRPVAALSPVEHPCCWWEPTSCCTGSRRRIGS